MHLSTYSLWTGSSLIYPRQRIRLPSKMAASAFECGGILGKRAGVNSAYPQEVLTFLNKTVLVVVILMFVAWLAMILFFLYNLTRAQKPEFKEIITLYQLFQPSKPTTEPDFLAFAPRETQQIPIVVVEDCGRMECTRVVSEADSLTKLIRDDADKV